MNNKKRINVNMSLKLIDMVDDYADNLGLSRTSAIVILVSNALEQKNTIEVMEEVMQEIKKEN